MRGLSIIFFGDLLSGLDEGEPVESGGGADELTAAADNELVRLVNKIIVEAYQQGASDIHIEPRPGKEKTLVRFRKDGALRTYLELPPNYRNAMKALIDEEILKAGLPAQDLADLIRQLSEQMHTAAARCPGPCAPAPASGSVPTGAARTAGVWWPARRDRRAAP